MERRPPSFLEVVGIVWKVAFAILLIPALALLVYVALNVLGPVTIATAVIAFLIAGGLVLIRRRR
jgi:hypothetical protein